MRKCHLDKDLKGMSKRVMWLSGERADLGRGREGTVQRLEVGACLVYLWSSKEASGSREVAGAGRTREKRAEDWIRKAAGGQILPCRPL